MHMEEIALKIVYSYLGGPDKLAFRASSQIHAQLPVPDPAPLSTNLRDIYEYLLLADRMFLRECSRLHAELPLICEMTWNYAVDSVRRTPRAYTTFRKRARIANRCYNEVTVWNGRCADCRKFACMWHSTRLTLENFQRVNLCTPCQIARGMFR